MLGLTISDYRNCPNCKTLRKATKSLSLSRLPPVLLIHLKRFTTKGHFTDKLETFIDFPLSGLDLTNYMPAPLPPGIDRRSTAPISLDDPRSQVPPYKYDLYAVTNHFGTLSSGHCKSVVRSLLVRHSKMFSLQIPLSLNHRVAGYTVTIAALRQRILARSSVNQRMCFITNVSIGDRYNFYFSLDKSRTAVFYMLSVKFL